jgi:hypothetical protein
MGKTLNKKLVQDAIDNNDSILGELTIHHTYAGRALRGEVCFGVSGDWGELLKFVSALTAEIMLRAVTHADSTEGIYDDSEQAAYEAISLFSNTKTDAYGLSGIMYFPGWTLEDVDEDDD